MRFRSRAAAGKLECRADTRGDDPPHRALRRTVSHGPASLVTMEYTTVTADQFAALEGVEDWRGLAHSILSEFRAGSFPDAASLVSAIAAEDESSQHHPDVDLRYPGRVRVLLTTHAAGGLTTLDVDLAKKVSALAAEAGASAEPPAPKSVEIAIDTMDADRIRPFWAAVLGYRERDGALFDP